MNEEYKATWAGGNIGSCPHCGASGEGSYPERIGEDDWFEGTMRKGGWEFHCPICKKSWWTVFYMDWVIEDEQ